MSTHQALRQTRQETFALIETMLTQGVITPEELSRYARSIQDTSSPIVVHQTLESWYRSLGIESVIKRPFSLSACPFTREEIAEAEQHGDFILCVPANVTREQLGLLFRLDSWALHDPLATEATEKSDFWFRTSMSLQPEYLYRSGTEIKHLFREEGKIHFSLERYMVFIARVRSITNQLPDSQYWIWLPHRSYDRSGMLIAGIDRNGSFNVHGWMPQFSASFLGARYGLLPAAL